jgi:hypothetical protein
VRFVVGIAGILPSIASSAVTKQDITELPTGRKELHFSEVMRNLLLVF